MKINISILLFISALSAFCQTPYHRIIPIRTDTQLVINDYRDIDSLKLWLDGADTDGDFTLDEETGAAPAVWDDKSDNDYDFDRSGDPQILDAALNGHDVIDFDGTGDRYISDEAASTWKFLHDGTSLTIFYVVKPSNTVDPDVAYAFMGNNAGSSSNAGLALWYEDRSSAGADNTYKVFLTIDGTPFYVINTDPTENNDAFSSNNYHLVYHELDPDNGTAIEREQTNIDGNSYDGVNTYTNTPSTSNPTYTLQVGSAGNGAVLLTGQIAEVVIYSRDLTTQETTAVVNYSTGKWGL